MQCRQFSILWLIYNKTKWKTLSPKTFLALHVIMNSGKFINDSFSAPFVHKSECVQRIMSENLLNEVHETKPAF